MLNLLSTFRIIDNSGASVGRLIKVSKAKVSRRPALVGDEITCVIQSMRRNLNVTKQSRARQVKKSDIKKAVVVRSKKESRRPDGSTIRFDDNAAVLVNPKKQLFASRVGSVVADEVRRKGWERIAAAAPKSV